MPMRSAGPSSSDISCSYFLSLSLIGRLFQVPGIQLSRIRDCPLLATSAVMLEIMFGDVLKFYNCVITD